MALARHEATTNVVIGVRDEHGKDQWLSVSSRPHRRRRGTDNAGAVVCSVSDITERKQLLDRLAWEARNDPLTGARQPQRLPGRRAGAPSRTATPRR